MNTEPAKPKTPVQRFVIWRRLWFDFRAIMWFWCWLFWRTGLPFSLVLTRRLYQQELEMRACARRAKQNAIVRNADKLSALHKRMQIAQAEVEHRNNFTDDQSR